MKNQGRKCHQGHGRKCNQGRNCNIKIENAIKVESATWQKMEHEGTVQLDQGRKCHQGKEGMIKAYNVVKV